MNSTFRNWKVLGWVIDDDEQLMRALNQEDPSFDLSDYIKDYKTDSYDDDVRLLFEEAPIKLNLGGESDKLKIIPTDKSIGVFDFSLASRGLYRVPEYYSSELALEKPTRFSGYDLPSGVVPPNFVKETSLFNEKVFLFIDDDGKSYNCEIRQKGETAIEQNIPGSKLKFSTRNRKIYLTYKKKGGKVKYVEIYSLFYYTSLVGDTEYAIRHIPALMIAEHLEKQGVKVRVYMTRFVQLDSFALRDTVDGAKMPQDEMVNNLGGVINRDQTLFIQPIIAKDFGEEFDKGKALAISSNDYDNIYRTIARWSLKKETLSRSPGIFGNPDWRQNDYYEGFERYRNKYQLYVKEGIFKSKEVLPEAMIFFHDYVIKLHLSQFIQASDGIQFIRNKNYSNRAAMLSSVDVNPFFNFWMKTSANVLKHKIDLINTNDHVKEVKSIQKDLENTYDEFLNILNNANNDKNTTNRTYKSTLRDFFERWGLTILGKDEGYNIIDVNNNNEITTRAYILNITEEITLYADGNLFETPQEERDKRDALLEQILTAISSL